MTLDRRFLILYGAAGGVRIKEKYVSMRIKKKKKPNILENCFCVSVCVEEEISKF